jgi:hypothetical protein
MSDTLNPAKVSFHRAKESLDLIKEIGWEPTSFANSARAMRAWSDLLTYGNRVFTKLEQASKATGKGMAWFGGVKRRRKSDPVLTYMQHARNVDEHGLAQVLHNDGGSFHVEIPQHLIDEGKASSKCTLTEIRPPFIRK